MKKSLILCFVALFFAFSTNTGCIKSPGGTNISLPDLSNFSIQAVGTFVKGASTLISLASSTLGSGTFNVNFSITGANNLSNQVATLTMNGSAGTFSTPVLNGSGESTIIINSISNSAGGSANVTSNNSMVFYDSTGLMTATVAGTGGGPTSFRGTHVTASLAGTLLSIDGVMWTPWLTTITLYLDYYSGATGPVYFNSSDLSAFPRDTYSSFNGSTAYGVAGNGLAISDLSAHGVVNITATTPLITGTFSFTNSDSSTVSSGNFSCPAP